MARASPARILLAAAALVLVGVRGAAAAPDDVRVSPWSGFLPGAEPPGTRAVLVVDGRTGEPVRRAEVRGYARDRSPLAPLRPPTVVYAETDAKGLALVGPDSARAAAFHWVVAAQGYAPFAAAGALPARVALFQGQQVAGVVREADGSVWAHGTVELLASGPHGPVLRSVETDRAGRFALDRVEPHQHEFPQSLRFLGLRGNGGEAQRLSRFVERGDAAGEFVAAASIVVLGAVRDARYRPVKGAVVRGPRGVDRAETDDLGRFRLAGLRRNERIEFFHESWRGGLEPFHVAAGSEGLYPLLVTLPAAGSAPLVEVADPLRVFVTATGDAGEYPVMGFPVRIVSRDGEVHEASTSKNLAAGPLGSAAFPVAWQGMRVIVGTPFSRFWHQAFRRVEPENERRLSMTVPDTQARLGLDLWGVPPGSSATLSYEGDVCKVPLTQEEGAESVYLPPMGRAFLRVDGPDGWTEVVRVHPVLEGVRTAMVRWPRPRHFLLDLGANPDLSEDGPPIASTCAFQKEVTPAGLLLRTHARGHLRWRMPRGWREHGQALGQGEAMAQADGIDGQDQEPTVLTPVVLPLRMLSLAYGDGSAATDATLEGAREGALDFFQLDSSGSQRSTTLGPGVRVHARADDHVDLDAALWGDGPYTLRWGPVGLLLSVRAGDGPAARFVVCIRGRLYAGRDGALRLEGFQPGRHEWLMGAPGFRTVRVRGLAPAAGTWTVPLVLEPLE